jgi:hypothetical protein
LEFEAHYKAPEEGDGSIVVLEDQAIDLTAFDFTNRARWTARRQLRVRS